MLWFFCAGLTVFWAFHRAFIRERNRSGLELILSMPVLLAGLSYALKSPWINVLLFPYLVFLCFRVPLGQAIVATLLAPVMTVGWVIGRREDAYGVMLPGALFCALLATTLFTGSLVKRLRREQETVEESLASIRSRVEEDKDDPGVISEEAVISDYLAERHKTDADIMAVLNAVKASLVADSATFFEKDPSGSLAVRCSTDHIKGFTLTNGGIISAVLKNGNGLVAADIREKKADPGYIKSEEFDSLAAVRVMGGEQALGILAVDSDRHRAFSKKTDLENLTFFANVISLILERARVYHSVNREHFALKTLTDESQDLISTLDIKELSWGILKGVYRICGEPVVIFLKEEGKNTYTIPASWDIPLPEKKEFVLSGTMLEIPVKNQQKFYLGDLSTYRGKLFPFKHGQVSSILCMPLIFKEEVKGIIAAVSEKKNAFAFQQNYYDVRILDLFLRMASMSLTNALNHEKIARLSRTDGLTGLFNHRYFQECLESEIKRIGRTMVPLSLILADIDFFKNVNDTYGHPAGDAVLRSVAGIIRKRMRETDIAARYGGEEFAIILTNTDSKGARIFAEDLRKDVGKAEFPVDGKVLNMSISLGVASLPGDAKSKEELVERADQALYRAKQSGRNRSVLWSEMKR